MPSVVLAALGFPAGILLGLLIAWSPWGIAPAAALLVLAIKRPLAPLLVALAAGVLWGAGARAARRHDCRLRWREGERVAVIAAPSDFATEPAATRRFEVIAPSACAGPLMVRLPRPDSSSATLALAGTWRRDPLAVDARVPAAPERMGQLLVSASHPVATPAGLRTRIRVAAERRLASLYGPARWQLAAAITVSPDAGIPREIRQQFAAAGLAHLLALSGLQVGIVAAALMLLLRLARLSPQRARTASIPLIAAWIWLLGFPAGALRVSVLLLLWCWARSRQRPPAPSTVLASCALMLAALEPLAILKPGPWLSMAGVLGCVSAARWWQRVVDETPGSRRRLLRRLTPLAISAGAVLATAPIQALAFGMVAPIGIITNVVAIPVAMVTTPALGLSLAACSLGGARLAALFASAAGLGLDLLQAVAAAGAALTGQPAPLAHPIAMTIAAMLLADWLLRPASRRLKARAVLGWRSASAGAAMLALLAWSPMLASAGAPDGERRLTIHFLDVGQGDAAVIRTPHGHWVVIDGGPREPGLDEGARKVVPALRRAGAKAVDVLIASHGDADHMGGLPAVLTALPVGLAMEPGSPLGRPLYSEWLGDIAKDGARWHPARAGDTILLDGVTLRVWHPDSATIAAGWEPNDNSVVLTVEYGAFRALFVGDAGLPMEALRAGTIGPVTMLKVGHHGSRTATGDAWLEALKPKVCVIEVGARNRYGHPDPGTVARLRAAGCGPWRTDKDGDVDAITDGRTAQVRAAARDTTLVLCEDPCGNR